MNHPNAWTRESIAYCSNVHPGDSLEQVESNIRDRIQRVRQNRHLGRMEAGLWLSATAAAQLQHGQRLQAFRQTLADAAIQLTSLNGFPFGNFHQQRVKQQVYQPDWSQNERLTYTLQLAHILADCLADNQTTGAISTVPLGYAANWDDSRHKQAAHNLREIAQQLHTLHHRTGKHILLCIEMEPDCVLESTEALIAFFSQHLADDIQRKYIGVCYDVCHQAVMHEDIRLSLQALDRAGITIGKIQISSAMRVTPNQANKLQTLDRLRAFADPRYLHQIKTRDNNGKLHRLTDLESLFQEAGDADSLPWDNDWLIHFHVPVYARQLSHESLQTTQHQITQVFDFFEQHSARPFLEVETYTWSALPESLRPDTEEALLAGISHELQWVEQQLQHRNLLTHAS